MPAMGKAVHMQAPPEAVTAANSTGSADPAADTDPLRSMPTTEPLSPRAGAEMTDLEHAVVLLAVDFLASCAALALGLLLLSALSSAPLNALARFPSNAADDCLLPVAIIVALAISGSYRSVHRALLPSTLAEWKDLTFAIGAGCILLLGIGALGHAAFGTAQLNATQLVVVVLVAAILVGIGRAMVRAWVQTFRTTRVVVVGSGALSDRIAVHLRLQKGMALVGRVVDGTEVEAGAIGTVGDLPRICPELSIDRVIVCPSERPTADSISVYRAIQDHVHVAVVPRQYELISWRSKLTELSGLPLLEFAPAHMTRWDRALKRAFDVSVAGLALVLASPVLLAIAIAVRTTSPGPVLFRQERIGRNRRQFTINKFRTMTVGTFRPDSGASPASPAPVADEGSALWQVRKKHDERHRITKIGSFLRKTGLDELPQLWNVLLGDMAIVGPRPFVSHESDDLDDWTARRFEVRPGITGLWQVSGRNELSAEDLRQLDYLYVVSWSMWWDFKIILDTPRAMVRGLGAY